MELLQAKAHPFPPHVRVLCGDIGETVSPDDFYPWKKGARITLSDELASTNCAPSTAGF